MKDYRKYLTSHITPVVALCAAIWAGFGSAVPSSNQIIFTIGDIAFTCLTFFFAVYEGVRDERQNKKHLEQIAKEASERDGQLLNLQQTQRHPFNDNGPLL